MLTLDYTIMKMEMNTTTICDHMKKKKYNNFVVETKSNVLY